MKSTLTSGISLLTSRARSVAAQHKHDSVQIVAMHICVTQNRHAGRCKQQRKAVRLTSFDLVLASRPTVLLYACLAAIDAVCD